MMSAKVKYNRFLDEYQAFVQSELGLKRFLLYGPMSEDYWATPMKVLICNLEPYSITSPSVLRVDHETIDTNLGWLWNRTIRFSALQAHAFFEQFNNTRSTEEQLKVDINDYELLGKTLRKFAYMNLRITRSKSVRADKKNIVMNVSRTREMIRKQISLLDPTVIFVGGQIGTAQFNEICGTSLAYLGMTTVDGRRIAISTRHPSRAQYVGLFENANRANLAIKRLPLLPKAIK